MADPRTVSDRPSPQGDAGAASTSPPSAGAPSAGVMPLGRTLPAKLPVSTEPTPTLGIPSLPPYSVDETVPQTPGTSAVQVPGNAQGSTAARAALTTIGQNTIDLEDKTFIRGTIATASAVHSGTGRRQFGEYELVRELARGGMGVVYEAVQTRLKRTVAVKMILSGEFASDEQVQRFFAEARSVANLDHPHIVPVYEVAEQNGQHFFSMKLVDGGSLSSRLHSFRGEFRKAAELVEKVARAVHHAHQRGVLHRDLKPGNILLDRQGEPMVTDFGLAKMVADDSNVTRSDAVVGTPAYMAPEQVLGARYTTTSTDIWALGVILYQLVTQTQPFKGETSHETLRQVMENEPPRPRQLEPSLPRDLETICLKCLQKDQPKRYPTGEALANDLRRFLAGEPVEARPVSTPERLWRWCRRNPGLAISGGAAMVAAAAAIVILSVAVGIISDREQKANQLADDNANLLTSERALSRARERDNVNLRLEQAVKQCELDAGIGLLMLARVLSEAEAIGASDLAMSTRLQLSAWGRAVHPLRSVIRASATSVTHTAMSPDGSTVYVFSTDRHLRAFDATTGKAAGTVDCGKLATAVGVDPTSGAVLVAFDDGTSRWWHPRADHPLPQATPVHPGGNAITAIAFGRKSQRLLTCGADGTARLWDAMSGAPVGPVFRHGSPIAVGAISSDGGRIATGGDDGIVRLWEIQTGQAVGREIQGRGRVWGLAFREGQPQLVVVTESFAMICQAADGSPVMTLRQPPGGTFAITLSPDGLHVVLAELGDFARVMSLSGPLETRVPLRHGASVTAQAFSADGRSVVTGSGDGLLRVWRVAEHRQPTPAVPDGTRSAALDQSGCLAAVLTKERGVRIIDPASGRIAASFADDAHAEAIAFSPDGTKVLVGSSDDTASLWDVAMQRRIGEPVQVGSLVRITGFSPDGQVVMIGGDHGLLHLRRAKDLSPIGDPIEHEEMRTAAFSPDGRSVVTAGEDGVARIWPVEGPRVPAKELHHDARIRAVAFSPDGSRLATGGQDAVARLWDLATARTIGQPMAHQEEVQMLAFSPTGQWLATGEPSRVVRLWDARTGIARRQPIALPDKPESLAFSPDGSRLVVGCIGVDGWVIVWDVLGHRAIGPMLRRQSSITSVAFPPTGDVAMIATVEGDVRLHPVRPVEGKPADIIGWAQSLTGISLDEAGAVKVLDPRRP